MFTNFQGETEKIMKPGHGQITTSMSTAEVLFFPVEWPWHSFPEVINEWTGCRVMNRLEPLQGRCQPSWISIWSKPWYSPVTRKSNNYFNILATSPTFYILLFVHFLLPASQKLGGSVGLKSPQNQHLQVIIDIFFVLPGFLSLVWMTLLWVFSEEPFLEKTRGRFIVG